MIEVAAFRVVFASNIENGNGFISQVDFGRFATIDRLGVFRQKDGTSKKLVLVRPTWMSNDGIDHKRRTLSLSLSTFLQTPVSDSCVQVRADAGAAAIRDTNKQNKTVSRVFISSFSSSR